MPRPTRHAFNRRAAALILASLATTAQAQEQADAPTVDTVTMKDGRTVAGPILKETPQMVWIDLGFDVLSVPRTEILDIIRAQAVQAKVKTNELYRTVDASRLPVSTPAELAKRFGEAVIKVSTPSGLGSGYIIHPDGYAITNAHVIQGETRIQATVFEQGAREFTRVTIDDVKIIAVNSHIDLALIKLARPNDEPFHAVYVQDEEDLEVGQEVFAIGNPLGLERTLSSGVIATTQRNFEGLTFVQTTAEINPGNSGGPLFNLKGEVIGTINMGALAADGIGFAIPARYVRDFIRNNEAFAYDRENPNSGYNYLNAPPRRDFGAPSILDDATGQ